jgi:hypothetical protein
LAPHDRRLRARRFEVEAFGPRVPTLRGDGLRRLLVAGPFRFATVDDARAYALSLEVGEHITITLVAPQSARYADGPWQSAVVETIERVPA